MDRKEKIKEIKKVIDDVLDFKKSASLGAVEIYNIFEDEIKYLTEPSENSK